MITKPRRFKKGDSQSIFFYLSIAIFLFLIIGFLIFTNLKINRRRQELLSQIDFLKKEIQTLEEKNTQLKAGISQLGEPSYLEEKIRDQGYKKPGEEVVAIKKVITEEEKEPEKEKNLLEKFLEFFKIKQ